MITSPELFIKTINNFIYRFMIYGSLIDLEFMDKLFNSKPLDHAKNAFS